MKGTLKGCDVTEVEALRRFIPILGRISAPSERATITRNLLQRIAGQQTSIMAISHKHAGALAWPSDHAMALNFEHFLDAAVETGEFVSTLHQVSPRFLQIEELLAWPDCPKIDSESPLKFWLTEAVQPAMPATPAHDTTPPALVVAGNEPVPARKRPSKRRTWRDVAMPYVVETYRAGKYKTAHVFYVALVNKAGLENSPFTLHDRELFMTDIGKSLAEKTIGNAMPEIKTAARQA